MTPLSKELKGVMEKITKGEYGSMGIVIKLLMLLCRAIILGEK